MKLYLSTTIILLSLLSTFQVKANKDAASSSSSSTAMATPIRTVESKTLRYEVISGTQIDKGWITSMKNMDVKGYKINGYGTQITNVTPIIFSDNSALSGATYSNTIKSYNAAGRSGVSSETNAVATMAQTENLALNKPATASSYEYQDASYAVNGNYDQGDFWSASPYAQWWQVDLQNEYFLNRIVVVTFYDGSRYYKYDIQGSLDGTSWSPLVDFNNNTTPATAAGNSFNINNVKARYIRVNMNYNTTNSAVHIIEFEAYGSTSNPSGNDVTPPSTPTNLMAVPTSPTSINLNWTASTDNIAVAGYEIYRDGTLLTNTTSLSYSDNLVLPGTTHSYTIKSYDAAGNQSALSQPASVSTISPSANIALNKPATASSFEYNNASYAVDGNYDQWDFWSASPYAQWWQVDLQNEYLLNRIVVVTFYDGNRYYRYDIQGSLDGTTWFSLVDFNNNTTPATAAGNSFNINNVKARYIRVNMNYNTTNSAVHIIEFEAYGAVSTGSTTPSAPTNLLAVSTSGSQVNLSWIDNSSNETGFKIEQKTGTGNFTEIATVGAGITTYTNTGLAAGTSYTYRVRAYNTDGNSGYSNEIAVTPPLIPTAPTVLTATAISGTQINLSWTDNANNEDGFKIEQKIGTGSFTQIATVAANIATYSNTGLTAGTSYTYRVLAYNAGGSSGYSNESVATTQIASNAKIYINFKDPNVANAPAPWNNTENYSAGATLSNLVNDQQQTTTVGLQLLDSWTLTNTLGMSSGIYPTEVMLTAFYIDDDNQRHVRVFGLDPAQKYSFTFFASRGGDGNRYTQYTINGLTVELNASNNTSNTVQIAGISPTASGEILIIVNRKAGALYGYLNALVITPGILPSQVPESPSLLSGTAVSATQVNLSWTDNSSNETGFKIEQKTGAGNFTEIATVGAGITSYSNTGLTAGTSYSYQVRAYNTGGNSGYSNEIAVTPPLIPAAPTVLTATAISGTQVNLSWTDNANNEDGFKIEQKIGTGSFTQIATVTANVATYSSTGLTAGTSYTYRVLAYNAGGSSGYSNESVATTQIASNAKIYINFKDPNVANAPAPWNNTENYSGSTALSNLVNDQQQTTTVGLQLLDSWTLTNTLGMSSGIYPTEVMLTAFYIDDDNQRHVRVFGLDPAQKYSFTFFASRSGDGNRYTQYTINGITVELNASNNTSNTVQIAGVSPTASGEVLIVVNRKAGALYGYLNALVITPGILPSQVPESPSLLSGTAVSATQVNLSWTDNSSNETGFKIEQKTGAGNFTEIATVGAGITSYSNTGLTSGTSYSYQVRAYNTGGNSGYSNEIAVTPPLIPTAPTVLTATAISGTQVNLSWTDNANNEDGFKIEQKIGTGSFTQIATVAANATTYNNNGLTAGTSYTYRVLAYNTGGNSGYSNEIAVTPTLIPTAPTVLSATAISGTQVNLSWTDNANNEDGFKIEQKIGAGSFTEIATVAANVAMYSNTGLTAGTSYTYRVLAYNTGGNSGYSNEIAVTPPLIPTSPTVLTATAVSGTQVNLSWTDNANDEDGFRIEQKIGTGSFTQIATVATNATTYSNTGLTAGTSYTYRVVAYNTGGNSGYSNEIAVTPPLIPIAPTVLTAIAISGTQVNLSWTDNANNEDGFKIEQKIGTGSFTQIATVAANATTYNNTGLTAGASYTYRVLAYNTGGNSGYSNEIAVTPTLIPTAPTVLSATAISGTQVNLSWTDNANNEDGFKIEQKIGAGSFTEIATVAANVAMYSNTGLTAGTSYTYRVLAYNTGGNSGYSNEIAVTPPLIPTLPTVLTATVISGTQVNLTWTDNANNEDGFTIEQKIGTGNFTEIAIVTANATTYSNTGLTAGTSYTYRVSAYNTGGNSGYSNEIAIIPPLIPTSPTVLTATAISGTQVNVTWTDNANNEDGFKIEQNAGSGFIEIATVGANVVTYCSKGLTAGINYTYRVSSFNVSGISAYSDEVNSTPPMLPVTPTDLYVRLSPENTEILTLSWQDKSIDEDGFMIEQQLSDGNYKEIYNFIDKSQITTRFTILYRLANVRPGNIYSFRVRAYNIGGYSSYTNVATITTPSGPMCPSKAKAIAISGSQINLEWLDNSSFEDGYRIERKTEYNGIYYEIAAVGANVTKFTDTGLEGSTRYFYRVRAYDISGMSNYSGETNENYATTDPDRPLAPSALNVNILMGEIKLSWNDNSLREVGFKIERKKAGENFIQIAQVGANTVVYEDIPIYPNWIYPNTVYTYRISAYNSVGYSDYIETTITTPTPPIAPTGLNATVLPGNIIRFVWNDNSNNEVGFKICVYDFLHDNWDEEVATIPANVTSYDLNGLWPSSYDFLIKSYNFSGENVSDPIYNVELFSVPKTPTRLSATIISSTETDLWWTDNSDDEKGYKIERNNGGGYVEVATVSANVINYKDIEITPSAGYTYRVRAYNDNVNSSYSNEAHSYPPGLPSAPTTLNITHYAGADYVKLSWIDNSNNEDGFKIESRIGSGVYTEIESVDADIKTCGASFTKGNECAYRIRAYNRTGNSEYTNEVTFPAFLPAGPTNLSVSTASVTQLDLYWEDNSDNEDQFFIYRNEGNYYVYIAAVGANVTTFSDKGLKQGVTYTYRVSASNSIGDSPYSNEASGIPHNQPPIAPSSLSVTVNGNNAELAWTDNSNDEDGFRIVQKIGGGIYEEIFIDRNITSYTHSGFNPAATYCICAYNIRGSSAYTNEVLAPLSPTSLTATVVSCTQVDLSWTDNTNNEEGFRIEQKIGSGSYAVIASVGANVNTYSNTSLTTGLNYTYRVCAYIGGNSAYSNEVSATPPSLPVAPTTFAATTIPDTQVNFSWTDNATNEDGFRIEQKYGNGNFAEIATVLADATSYQIYGITPGTNTFRVRAFNQGGFSTYSNEATIVIEGNSLILYTSSTQMNAVESVTYDASGKITGQAIAYSDLLGRSTQMQSRNISQNSVMVSQTIYDALGRPTISTLAAPVPQQNLNYVADFATNIHGDEYNYANFDGKSSADVIFGKLADYYSNGNTLEPYVPASSDPYTRVEYSKLQPGVTRKSAAPGINLRFGSGHESQTYTMAVPESELLDFASDFTALTDVKLETKGITKTIGMDPDGNTSIVYSSASGQQIASCFADASAEAQNITIYDFPSSGYIDIHLVKNDNILLHDYTCYIYDLSNDGKYSGTYTGSVALNKGVYRLQVASVEVLTSSYVSYNQYYKGHSFNFYDNAGRSVFSLSPKGYKEWKAESTKSFANMKKYATYNEYNSLGWLLSSSSPDEGLTTYRYATDGRIRFSQNAQQKPTVTHSVEKFSYTNYDDANRPVENGECTGSYASADLTADVTEYISQWTRTFYDYPADTITCSKLPQNYTIGKIAKTSTVNDSTYYSYTYDGKVEWVVQKIVGLGRKTIEYIYEDDITGRISKVIYQHGGGDEFTHHYTYDPDGRLEYVYTKKRGDATEKLQAHYIYYAHGPLKRVELGGNLQGIDYVYTINGQLKSINHPDLTANDPGGDGYAGGTHNGFKPDVFGMSLDYYSGDYSRTGTNIISMYNLSSKYNGVITASRWNTQGQHAVLDHQWAYKYTYDNRGFLSQAIFGTADGNATTSGFASNNAFSETITGYDENGNIQGLNRYANGLMDGLTYHYLDKSNKLNYVSDTQGASVKGTDIANQDDGNYTYNDIGQMTGNVQDKQYFTYDVYGHVTSIINEAGNVDATYTYNDKGFRIKKETKGRTTWYVRDASGQILATYEGTTPVLDEVSIYGSTRIGQAQANTASGVLEKYMYELTDHLGNVRATISANATGGLDVLSYADYYPFGMEMPGRNKKASDSYKYGYQGQYAEKDESGYNHFEARDYDSRIGRWLIPDPKRQFWSPYLGMGNNPIIGVDPDGRGWLQAHFLAAWHKVIGDEGTGAWKDADGNWWAKWQNSSENYTSLAKETTVVGHRFNTGKNVTAKDIWHSDFARRGIPDMFSISIDYSMVFGVGAGTNMQLNFITRGKDWGFFFTHTPTVRAGLEAQIGIYGSASSFNGEVSQLTRESYLGPTVDVGGKYLGGLDIGASLDPNGKGKNKISWLTLKAGFGFQGGGSAGYGNTIKGLPKD